MYDDEYNKILEQMKTAIELAKDNKNIQQCKEHIQYYDRINAWTYLQDMIREYHSQIELFGHLFDGMGILKNTCLDSLSDDEIKKELLYLAQHIPAYVLLRKGEKELAKEIFARMNVNK